MKKTYLSLFVAIATHAAYANNLMTETVVVSAARSETRSAITPTNIQIISAEDIRANGASSLADILQGYSGIVIQDVLGSRNRGATISMRGFSEASANNILVLIDGRKLNNPSMSPPDLSSISMKDIERIEIINGSAGTLYGEQAIAGVINIITKKATTLSGNLETTFGNNDHQDYSASLSQSFDNGFHYRVSGKKQLDDNYRDNNEANYENVLANVGYVWQTGRVLAETQQINDHMNYAGPLNTEQQHINRQQSVTPDDFSNRKNTADRLGAYFNLSPNWELGGEYTHRDQEGKGMLYGNPLTETTSVKTWNPRLHGNTTLANKTLSLVVGADFQKTDYQQFSTLSQTIEDWYAQATLELTTNTTLTVGGRNSAIQEKNHTTRLDHHDSHDVYLVGLSYQLDTNQRFFIRRDEGFRWSNVDENALVLPGITFLNPQQSVSTELGYEFRSQSFSLDAVIYDMDLTDEILYDSEIANPNSYYGVGANINLDSSQRQGLTLGGTWQITQQWQFSTHTSVTDSKFNDGSFKGATVPFVAENTATSTLRYQPTSAWSLFIQAVYTGKRYPASDYFNTAEKLGGYTIYNANIRYDHKHWFGQLRLDNISNKLYNGFTYLGGSGYPAPERTARFTLGYQF